MGYGLHDVQGALSQRLDAEVREGEVIGVVREPHPRAKAVGERCEPARGRVDAETDFMHHEVGLREPLDEAGVELGVGAEGDAPATCRDPERGGRDVVTGESALDREGADRHGASPVQRRHLEEVLEPMADQLPPVVPKQLHAAGQVTIPEAGRDDWVDREAGTPSEREVAEEAEPLEPGGVIRVEVGEGDGLDPVEVELDVGLHRGVTQHLPDGVRAVDEEPPLLCAQREARGVVLRREGVADAEDEKLEADGHGLTLRRVDWVYNQPMGRPTVRLQRRAEITAAFARVLSRQGYAGATINAVAAEAGVAPGLVHHHFEDKADLLDSLLDALIARFRWRTSVKETGTDALSAWLTAALELDDTSDVVEARCWVGVLAEAVRDRALGEKVRRLVDAEIEGIRRRSRGRFSPQEAGAILAFVLGSLVLGAFAPRRAAGFAAPAARAFVRGLA